MSQPASSSLTLSELTALLQQIFERHGTSTAVAEVMADNWARAQRDGSYSHGVFRIPGYLSSLASNWVDGQAVPVALLASTVTMTCAGAGLVALASLTWPSLLRAWNSYDAFGPATDRPSGAS